MNVIKFFYLLLVLSLLPNILVAAPKFPPPPQAKIGLLGDDLVVNGIPTEIRQFATPKSLDDVVEFYMELWEGDDKKLPEYTVSDALPPWKIVTHIEDNHILTVQVASDGKRGSSGYLAISPLIPDEKPELGQNFPMMRGSKVINEVFSNDSGKKGRTLTLRNSSSVGSNASFYKNHYENRGWATEMDSELFKGKTHSLRFRNGNKHVTLVLKKDRGGTTVTSQSVTESIF